MFSNKRKNSTRRSGKDAGVATPAQPQAYSKKNAPLAYDSFTATQQSRQEHLERDARLQNSVYFQDHRPDTNPIELEYPKQEEFRIGHFGAYNQSPGSVSKPGAPKNELPAQKYSQGHDYFLSQQPSNQYIGKGPKGYRRSPERIHEDACQLLFQNGEVDASDIDVKVHEGVVTLEGSVEARSMKKIAEYLIEGIAGVDDVHNHLTIANRKNEKIL